MLDKMRFLATLITLILLAGGVLVSAQGPDPQGDGSVQAALGTAFTYQGRLQQDGNPVNGNCDFQFSLWDAASGGAQVGTTQTRTGVAVSDGYFTIPDLDFGAGAFQGDARWLAVAVRCPAGGSSYTPLALRQALTAAPYALFSKAAPWSGLTGVPDGFADGVDNDTTYTAGAGLSLTSGQFSVNFAGSGVAATVARSDHTHDAAYWRLAGNSSTNPTTHFLGTTDNQALELRVNNARALRLEPNATSPNLIGGYSGNSVTGGVVGATIGGGGAAGSVNRVTDNYGTVGGGINNRAGDNAGTTSDQLYATVGGGYGNVAVAGATVGGGQLNNAGGLFATVGGGVENTAVFTGTTVSGGWHNSASHDYAAVGGGGGNTASGPASTVSGGWANAASGESATVGGGDYNVAAAAYATIAGGGPSNPSDPTNTNNRVTGDYGVIGGGGGNTASGPASTISGGWSNLASGESATVGGGDYNVAAAAYATIAGGGPWNPSDPTNTNNRVTDDYGAIGGGGGNRAGNGDGDPTNARHGTVGGGYNNAASGPSSTVGGGSSNTASGYWATVGGGTASTASDMGATVGGGQWNDATSSYATVSGGLDNAASDGGATVGGGGYNTASGSEATVGGGGHNTASGSEATVGGGGYNTASGYAATVPGGRDNTAQGAFSFAAGRRAKAYNQGCFVLADATDADEPCVNDNRFVFRVTNAFYIWTTADHSAGVLLPSGGNAWSSVSDRAAKENFAPVDGREVLERLAAIPIQTWNYRSQDPAIRHIGPVAQDFYAAFGVGEDDTHISTVDADGVALAAIQGLYAQNQELAAENAALRQRVDALEARLTALEQRAGNASVPAGIPFLLWPALGGLALFGAVVYWRGKGRGE